jgi:hypothetical protein
MPGLLFALLFSARPLDPIAADTLDFAFQRSAVVRALVDRLERSNVIVHIQSSLSLPGGIAGTTRFVVSRGDHRFLRITIKADLPPLTRAAILGHELQHACEVAASPAANTGDLRALFEQAGKRSGDFFETRAALEIERRVRMDLNGPRTELQAEPVVKFDH